MPPHGPHCLKLYGMSYQDLKQLARTRNERAFLPGASLWARPDDFAVPMAACKGNTLGTLSPPRCSRDGAECGEFPMMQALLKSSRRLPPNGSWNGGSGFRSKVLTVLLDARHEETQTE